MQKELVRLQKSATPAPAAPWEMRAGSEAQRNKVDQVGMRWYVDEMRQTWQENNCWFGAEFPGTTTFRASSAENGN